MKMSEPAATTPIPCMQTDRRAFSHVSFVVDYRVYLRSKLIPYYFRGTVVRTVIN